MTAGRPSDYKPAYAALAYKFCLLGATDEFLAEQFNTTTATIKTWRKRYPKFLAAIKNGKGEADANVAQSLYRRATGYSHVETKVFCHDGEILKTDVIKHYPPDTGAACMWLKNRARELWRDTKELKINELPTVKRVTKNYAGKSKRS